MPGIIQLTTAGQFGNALFQYCFARAYAERLGAALETLYWVGQRLFEGVKELPPSCKLSTTLMDDIPWEHSNLDLRGYFQHEDFLNLYSVKKAKEWLRFKPEWTDQFPKNGRYIAIHLRHGDYVTRYAHQFCCISAESAYQFAHQINRRLQYALPIVVVSEETAKDYDDPELSFLPDFFTLMQADYLIRANSSFSWWAGTLGNAKKIYSPVVGALVGWNEVEYVEGNAEPFLIYPRHGRLYLRPE